LAILSGHVAETTSTLTLTAALGISATGRTLAPGSAAAAPTAAALILVILPAQVALLAAPVLTGHSRGSTRRAGYSGSRVRLLRVELWRGIAHIFPGIGLRRSHNAVDIGLLHPQPAQQLPHVERKYHVELLRRVAGEHVGCGRPAHRLD